ncbi:MAG: hypothetical protein RSE41_00540 [Clostridia bacterium]
MKKIFNFSYIIIVITVGVLGTMYNMDYNNIKTNNITKTYECILDSVSYNKVSSNSYAFFGNFRYDNHSFRRVIDLDLYNNYKKDSIIKIDTTYNYISLDNYEMYKTIILATFISYMFCILIFAIQDNDPVKILMFFLLLSEICVIRMFS